MMDGPLVSVIMPAYNAEEYITESIQSVIDQTYQNWELIIIDDGSTDDTKIIARKWADKETRIVYLYQQNGKQGKARNYGIAESKGEYVAFLDSDDLWEKRKLEIQVLFLKNNPEINLVFSQGYYLTNEKRTDYNIELKKEWTKEDLPDFIEYNKIPMPSVLVKCVSLREAGCFVQSDQTQYGEDYLLWLILLCKNNKFSSLRDRLFYYRIHTNQVTSSHQSEAVEMLGIYRMFFHYYDDYISHRAIFRRIIWGIFDKQFGKQYFQFASKIIKHYQKTLSIGIEGISFLHNTGFGQKILIRIFRILEKFIFSSN